MPSFFSKAYASGNCRMEFDPVNITPNDKVFKVKITPLNEYPIGAPYALVVRDGGGFIEKRPIGFTGNGQEPIELSVSTPRSSPIGRATFDIYAVSDLGAFIRLAFNSPGECSEEKIIGYNPDCIIKPIIKEGSVGLKVEGLHPATEAVKRGLIGTSSNGLRPVITCLTEKELKEGYIVGETNQDGTYRLQLTQSCNIFNRADGPSFCRAPDQKVYIEVGVSKENGLSATGVECNPENIDDYQKSDDCNKKGIAPFCNKDKRSSKGGFCARIPDITEKCRTEKGETTCKTAIGTISTDPEKFITRMLSVILGLAGGIFLLFLIINGYRVMASRGDPERLKEARESITSAAVGLLFIIFSLFILELIARDILKIPGIG